jgi:hypothetical protein
MEPNTQDLCDCASCQKPFSEAAYWKSQAAYWQTLAGDTKDKLQDLKAALADAEEKLRGTYVYRLQRRIEELEAAAQKAKETDRGRILYFAHCSQRNLWDYLNANEALRIEREMRQRLQEDLKLALSSLAMEDSA